MSKKELEKAFLKLKEENNRLREELAYVRFELEDLRSKRYKSHKKKSPDDTLPSPPPPLKKRGGLFGHIGWFRKKPAPDRVEEIRLSSCPECGSKDLTECDKVHDHTQEDITLPRVEVTLYRKHRYYCKKCKRVVSSKGKDEIPGSRVGPKAKAFAAFLRFGIKISERDVCALFRRAFNLRIAASSISGFMDQLKGEALPIYNNLLSSLKKGSFIHADETGWSIDGINHWLWKFSNKKVCVSHIDKGRGQAVVEKMLGDKYKGVLISDFLSAYNKIEAKAKQRCLVHIGRDLDKVMEYWHDDKEVMRYCERLSKMFENATQLYEEYKGKIWDAAYCRRRELITQTLNDFKFPNPNKRILKRFAKRLIRHKGEILTFLYVKDIDPNNNHAERQIRPDVIFRKITFGNRSYNGAENHSVIMSIIQTAKLNGIDPIGVVEKIFLKSSDNPILKALSP